MDKKNDIRGLFKSSFDDFEAEVNEEAWINIEKALHPKSKRRFAWWQWAAAACLAGLILSYPIYTLNNNEATQLAEAGNSIEKNALQHKESISSGKENISSGRENISSRSEEHTSELQSH